MIKLKHLLNENNFNPKSKLLLVINSMIGKTPSETFFNSIDELKTYYNEIFDNYGSEISGYDVFELKRINIKMRK